jgi:hypothetical protein
LVDADLPEELYLQAVVEEDPLSGGGSGEEDARELRRLVLERKVGVARGLLPEVGDLPLDPDRPDSLLQQPTDPARQLGDGKDDRELGVGIWQLDAGNQAGGNRRGRLWRSRSPKG